MKVLVVGTGYIGRKFTEYVSGLNPGDSQYQLNVDIVDSRRGWLETNFEGYDSVIFTAGIAHRKQTKANKDSYFQVNRDLAVAVAKKAKAANVGQFVYLSSMSVYGKKEGEISEDTKPNPRHNDYYGQSKFQAEEELKKLNDANFALAILRPPMVYGSKCPGKFGLLKKLARWMRIIPDNNNRRSMIYVDNLSEFLCMVVWEKVRGIFLPQNELYVNTATLIKNLRLGMGKKTAIIPGLGWLLRIFMVFCPPLRTAFGSLYYTKD